MKWFLSGLGSVVMFGAAMFGMSVAKQWAEMRKPVRKVESLEQKHARVMEMLEKPKVEKRKYPRALPGGGLDWTGVERKNP